MVVNHSSDDDNSLCDPSNILDGRIKISAVSNPYDTNTNASQPVHNMMQLDTYNESAQSTNMSDEVVVDVLSAEQVIDVVRSQMLEYESACDYVNAQKCKNQLSILCDQLKLIKQKQLQSMQQNEINIYYSMCVQHRQNFTDTWARRLLEHKHRADVLIDKLKQKHINDAMIAVTSLRKSGHIPHSNALLTLRKQQHIHARNHDYIAANNCKEKADKLEHNENNTHQSTINTSINVRLDQLQCRQSIEKQQLSSKLHLEYKTLADIKLNEWNKLMKKLRYTETELKKSHTRQHMLLQSKFECQPVLSNTANTKKSHSRTSTLSKSGKQRNYM